MLFSLTRVGCVCTFIIYIIRYIIIIPRYNIINNGARYCNVGTDVYIIIRRNYPSQCDGDGRGVESSDSGYYFTV